MSLGAERQADGVTFSNVWVKAAGTISGQMWRMEVKKGPPSSQPLTHCLAKKEALSNICLLRHKAARNTLSACLLMPNSMYVMAFQLQLPLNLFLSEKPHVCCGTFTEQPARHSCWGPCTCIGTSLYSESPFSFKFIALTCLA